MSAKILPSVPSEIPIKIFNLNNFIWFLTFSLVLSRSKNLHSGWNPNRDILPSPQHVKSFDISPNLRSFTRMITLNLTILLQACSVCQRKIKSSLLTWADFSSVFLSVHLSGGKEILARYPVIWWRGVFSHFYTKHPRIFQCC